MYTHESGWEPRRYLVFVFVLALHVAFVAALLLSPSVRNRQAASPRPIELLYFPPARQPKIRSDNPLPHRVGGDAALSLMPPVLDSQTPAPSAAGSDGNGSGVDWAAEARRALQAFEIRSDEFDGGHSNSGPARDEWWPESKHHAGEQYKTGSGDWIVWINASCYQVASSNAPAYAPGAALPQTLCPGKSQEPSGGLFKARPAHKGSQPDR